MAQPVSAVADRNLLGLARRSNLASRVPGVPMEPPGGVAAVSALGGKNEIDDGIDDGIGGQGELGGAAADSLSRSVD